MPTEADTVAAHRRHSLDRFLSWPTFAAGFVAVAVLSGVALIALPPGFKGLSVLVVLGAALGGIAYPLLLIRFRVRALAKRLFRQRARSHSVISVDWSEHGFAATTATASSLTPWDHYFRWREDSQVVLLYLNEALFQFIPKRVLSEQQLASLRRLAASSGVPGARR